MGARWICQADFILPWGGGWQGNYTAIELRKQEELPLTYMAHVRSRLF